MKISTIELCLPFLSHGVQGNVLKCFVCGCILNDYFCCIFTAERKNNRLLNMNIWWSYDKNSMAYFLVHPLYTASAWKSHYGMRAWLLCFVDSRRQVVFMYCFLHSCNIIYCDYFCEFVVFSVYCTRMKRASLTDCSWKSLLLIGSGRRVSKSHCSCSCSSCCWNQFSVKGQKIPQAFLIRSGAQRNFAYTSVLTLPTDLPSQIFHLFSN